MLAHPYERVISDSEGDASKVEIQKRKHSVLTHFGDLKTVERKSDSRNNHQFAVVVQDLATQWIQSYPCKTKTSQETEKSLRKFLEPSQKPQGSYTNDLLKFGKSCEESSWNHRTATPHKRRD